jgi:hypothetical protein
MHAHPLRDWLCRQAHDSVECRRACDERNSAIAYHSFFRVRVDGRRLGGLHAVGVEGSDGCDGRGMGVGKLDQGTSWCTEVNPCEFERRTDPVKGLEREREGRRGQWSTL